MQYITWEKLPELITPTRVFVYPTDTIYGIGGMVTPQVVEKINQIKQRPTEKYYSLVAPSLERIPLYFAVPDPFAPERAKRKAQFPWRGLTLLLPLRHDRPHDIDFSLLSQTPTIGIRLLDHPLQVVLQKIWQPIITTSANITGHPTITHPWQLSNEQQQAVDFIIDEGKLLNPPSVVVDYTTQTVVRA